MDPVCFKGKWMPELTNKGRGWQINGIELQANKEIQNPVQFYLLAIVTLHRTGGNKALNNHFQLQSGGGKCFENAHSKNNMRLLPQQLEVHPNLVEFSQLLGYTGAMLGFKQKVVVQYSE
jgi:hypothetical protein